MLESKQPVRRLVVDPQEGTVSGPKGTVRLEPKVMAVLIVLGRYAGHVVSRADLLEAVWPNVVVTEHTLSRCVYQLRESLREVTVGRRHKDFNPIETLPKRGYRLLVEVERTPAELRVSGSSLLIELRRRHVLFVGVALFVVVVAVIIAILD